MILKLQTLGETIFQMTLTTKAVINYFNKIKRVPASDFKICAQELYSGTMHDSMHSDPRDGVKLDIEVAQINQLLYGASAIYEQTENPDTFLEIVDDT